MLILDREFLCCCNINEHAEHGPCFSLISFVNVNFPVLSKFLPYRILDQILVARQTNAANPKRK